MAKRHPTLELDLAAFRVDHPGLLEGYEALVRPTPAEDDDIQQEAIDAYEARKAHEQLDRLGVRRVSYGGEVLSLTARITLLEIALSPERHDV